MISIRTPENVLYINITFIFRFIPQDSIPVDDLILKSCPPVIPSDQYIALDDALVYENDKDRHIFRHCVLCWSTRSTLPKWVQLSKELSEVRKSLTKQKPKLLRLVRVISYCILVSM